MADLAAFETACDSGEVHEFELTGAKLVDPIHDVVFTDCHFMDVQFTCDELSLCKFIDCTFQKVTFNSVELNDCVFEQCRFYDADTESGCEFKFASLPGTCFRHCDLSMCRFSRANLYRVEMLECQAQGTDMSQISAESDIGGKVTLYDLTINQSNFAYSDFSGADIQSAVINECRLIHSDFSGANLTETDLKPNELHGITATRLTLRGADLRGSGLDGLDVRDIDMTGVIIDSAQQRVLLEAIGLIVKD